MKKCLIITDKDLAGSISDELHCELETSNELIDGYSGYMLIVFDKDIEFIRDVLENGSKAPFIGVFNKGTPSEVIYAMLEYGMVDFLIRPYGEDLLTSKINKFVLSNINSKRSIKRKLKAVNK